ncbi:MAG: hypothetical protein WCZ00_02250 [Acholeplasmataceae bacterium]
MDQQLKLVIVGGASVYVPLFIQNVISKSKEFKTSEIWLLDDEDKKDKMNIVEGFSNRLLKKHKLDTKVYATDDYKLALKDAQFVFSILGLEKDDHDLAEEKILYEHNMLADDLFGMKSSFKALRIVPKIYQLIEHMNEFCEQAWLINLSQPMGIISEAVFRYAETDKYLGISNIPSDMNQCFAKALGTKPNKLVVCAAGLSPMSFMTNVFQNQKDRLKELLDEVGSEENACFWSSTFLDDLGVFPSIDLKKVYFYEDVHQIFMDNYKNKHSVCQQDLRDQDKLMTVYQDQQNELCTKDMLEHKYMEDFKKAIDLISSIILDKRDYQVINTINNGHIMDIEEGAAIEVTARITKDGPMPVHISRLPNQVKGLLQHLKAFEQLLADAIYEKDLNKASLAIKSHPLMYNIREIDQAFHTFKLMNEKALAYFIKGDIHEII